MKKMILTFVVFFSFQLIFAQATELMISEYIEGSSYNKAIEIFNGTGANVDLSDYTLEKDANGAGSWSNNYDYTGFLADGEVFVLANSQADPAILNVADDTYDGVTNFNGNDALRLLKNGAVIDMFGNLSGNDFAANITMVRKLDIATPTTTWNIDEWTEYPQNTFAYLGFHILQNSLYDHSLEFDGVDDYVDFGNLDFISAGIQNEYTVSFWLNMESYNTVASGGQAVIFGDEVSQNNGILIQISTTEGYGAYTAGAGAGVGYSNYFPPLNQWVYFTQVQSTNGIDLYINGDYYQNLTNQTNSETSNNTTVGLHAGSSGPALRPFDGKMDKLTVWDKALTQQEIQNYMTTQLNGNENGLVGYWNFNEGSGTTAYDATANGNNGTINGAIYSTDVPGDIVLALNPIAYYPFNGNANDESGYGNNGVIYGSELDYDRFGDINSAYYFDGVNDYIQMDATIIPSSGDFTVNVWSKAESIQNDHSEMVSQNGDTGSHFYIGKDDNDYIRCGDDWLYTNVNFPLDQQWYLFSVTHNSTDTKLYINGVLEASTFNPYQNPAGNVFRVGRQHSANEEYFFGIIDDISVFDSFVVTATFYIL